MRERADRWIAAIASVLLIAALARILYARGGPYFTGPETIVDHVDVTKHVAHDVQLLGRRVRKMMPNGATVAGFTPAGGKAVEGIAEMLTAVDLLPDQRVRASYSVDDPSGFIPDWVIAVGGAFVDASRTNPVLRPDQAARYHSLMLDERSLPAALRVTARSDDGLLMAITHRSQPTFGLQFHPESIMTEHGGRLLANFLACVSVAA